MSNAPKPLRWFVPSRDEIREIPEDVRTTIGFKLRRLQNGEDAEDNDIKRFGEDDRIAHLVKIVAQGKDRNTYRTIATVQSLRVFGCSTSSRNGPRPGSGRRGGTSTGSMDA